MGKTSLAIFMSSKQNAHEAFALGQGPFDGAELAYLNFVCFV